tara:strand:+ start:568 stop:1191 length:624 start_codon:yes stop_codon:yes gene_type:complete
MIDWKHILKTKQIVTPTTDINIKKVPKKKTNKTECRDWLKGLYDEFEKHQEANVATIAHALEWTHDFPEELACIIKRILLQRSQPNENFSTADDFEYEVSGYHVEIAFKFKDYHNFAVMRIYIAKEHDSSDGEDDEVITPLETIVNMEVSANWNDFKGTLTQGPNFDRKYFKAVWNIGNYIKGNPSPLIDAFMEEYFDRYGEESDFE